MRGMQSHDRPYASLAAFAVAVCLWQMLGMACAPDADPFLTGERKAARETTPTPTPEVVTAALEGAEGEPEKVEASDMPIRIVASDEEIVSLSNFIAGYILVHGYGYLVELAEMDVPAYRDALPKGEVDILLETDPGWYEEYAESGAIIDIGSLPKAKPETRIVVHSSLKRRAPEVVQFLEKFAPEEEVLGNLAARMGGGRTGITANVAALTFLKNNEETWARWAPPPVVDNVKAAIESGNNSLCRNWVQKRRGPFLIGVCDD